jgi:ketosteroid isomerase-like protein
MARHEESDPAQVVERLRQAINQHDLDALAACFADDYRSEFPAHPDRAFRGHAQMTKNWTQIFGGVPDLAATLVTCAAAGDTAWAEWDWRGTRRDGAPFVMRGVTVQGVADGRIAWTRLYMEPVEVTGAGSDAAVRGTVAGPDPTTTAGATS